MLLSFADVLDDPELLQAHRAPGMLRAVENICDDRGRRTEEGSLGGLSLMSQICKNIARLHSRARVGEDPAPNLVCHRGFEKLTLTRVNLTRPSRGHVAHRHRPFT